jgi:quaternary ammonium compound-resistance protein SugE
MIQFLSNPLLAWPLVIIATVIETIWFIVLKKSGGLDIWPYNLIGYILIFIDVPLLAIAMKTLPSGSVYAFWTGTSAVAIALLGIYFFNEPATFWRLSFIFMIAVGIIGLQLSS